MFNYYVFLCRLSYFERNYCFLSQKQLVSEATKHYTGQAVKQLYVLVLGLDVIGNPFGLVVGISKGVEDLFYEPFQVNGIIMEIIQQIQVFLLHLFFTDIDIVDF